MAQPGGTDHVIEGGGYRAVVTQSGATLRELTFRGRHLILGHRADEMCSGGRGQQLIPWPNRIRDGHYRFDDLDLQLPLSEPALHNASHGLVRWVAWTGVADDHGHTVRMLYSLMSQPGYPWSLDLALTYAVSFSGLTVTVEATNVSARTAPFAYGAHPYLTTGSETVDGDTVRLLAASRLLTDPDQKLPCGTESVAGTAYDLSAGRRVGDLRLDDAFGELTYDEGHAVVSLTAPGGAGVELWAEDAFRWIQLFTADGAPGISRRGLAVEPMTAPADAFNSGTDLHVLAPGETFSTRWGIRAV